MTIPNNTTHICEFCRTPQRLPYGGDCESWCDECRAQTPHLRDISPMRDRDTSAAALLTRLQACWTDRPQQHSAAHGPAQAMLQARWPQHHIDGLRRMAGAGLDMARRLCRGVLERRGFTAVLFGPNGTGKTQIAAFCAWHRAKSGKGPGRLQTLPGLARALSGDMARGDDTNARMLSLTRCGFLTLDECQDTGDRSEWMRENMRHIVNERYNAQRSTLLLCNASDQQQLNDRIGGHILSRAQECGGVFQTDWPSYR